MKGMVEQIRCHCGCNGRIRHLNLAIIYNNNVYKEPIYFKNDKHFRNWRLIKEQLYADRKFNFKKKLH